MLSDIEIAQSAELKPIAEIANQLGISADELEFYGKYKAKLSDELADRVKDNPDGKLILVTAINPTPAGEGKTTTSVGLADALNAMGKKTMLATINMDGAAITITIMTLAAANTLGMQVSLPAAILLSIMSALGACGASGVAGGSLLLIPMACSLFGISNDIAMQVVGVGFIIGVIQDSVETAINSSSDALFTAVAEFKQWRKAGKEIKF